MDIAVGQGMEGLEILDLVDLKTDIGIGKDRRTCSTPQANDLIVTFPYTVKFDPGNVVFYRVGMGLIMTHNDPNDLFSTLMLLVNLYVGQMLLFPFIFSALMSAVKFILSTFFQLMFANFMLNISLPVINVDQHGPVLRTPECSK